MNKYSPHDLLPVKEPMFYAPEEADFFYKNVSKHLIPDIIRIMSNGIPIDFNEVEKLSGVVEDVLSKVQTTLDNNPIIKEFQELKYTQQQKDYIKEMESKKRTYEYYLKPFKAKDMAHRSYYVCQVIEDNNTGEYLPTGVPKWTVKDVKQYVEMFDTPELIKLLNDEPDELIAQEAMIALAKDKMAIYNKSYEDKIANVDSLELPKFNAGSSDQKRALFDWLGIECENFSKKTELPSWDRDEIERVNRETEDEHIKEFTQAFIDHSFSAIIRNNFIKAFYEYSIDDILYGNLKLFGAKSFRLTSNSPNLLNMPSTASIYAKPLKKCLTAPEGFVIVTADYSALEDRVIASISKDENKCNIFLEGLDGHCLNAYGYFKEEIGTHMELTGDTTTDVKKFFELADNGNKELKAIRQKGKPATFGLSYGAFPPKVAKGLKCTLEEATKIFNSYHQELYVDITKYREEYVLPTVIENGRIHLGLGCYIYSDNPEADIRTLVNATIQFWSILTLLTINKMHQLIDEAGLQDDVYCISTIYDSIYYLVREDAEIIKWVNDNLIEVMSKDFMEDQIVKNEAESEIGRNWADLTGVPNNASIEEIKQILKEI